MNGYAIELGRWLGALQRDDERRSACCATTSASHEKRLREIVHEANNPLSIIHNYLHILELRLKDSSGNARTAAPDRGGNPPHGGDLQTRRRVPAAVCDGPPSKPDVRVRRAST